KRRWAALAPAAPDGGRVVRLGATTADPRTSLGAKSDMRVEPILKSKWSQTVAGGSMNGSACYNYYTPPHGPGNAKNYPCGCVATAAGQILYRWKWPEGELAKFSNTCEVDGKEKTLQSHGDSRTYAWDDMVDVPVRSTPEESRQAIGALLSDLGISFGAGYAEAGTSAYEFNVPGPLRDKFNYASAFTYTVNGTGTRVSELHRDTVRQRAVLANLDAKRPVELYILSELAGGHAVVADGYGYVTISGEEVEFTHINMGWAGTDDMWYNLPVVKTKEAGSQGGQTGGYTFEYLMGATFNIHPTETGDILSGRVTDDDDEPAVDAPVSVCLAGSPDVIATTKTDAHGIYSFTLPAGTYDVSAVSSDGTKSGIREGVVLKETTVPAKSRLAGLDVAYSSVNANDIGNAWGQDVRVEIPSVRVVVGVETNVFSTLDSAIYAARAASAATPGEKMVLEVLLPTRLKATATIDFDCVLMATNAAPSASAVSRISGAQLVVAAGSALTMSNVVFAAGGNTVVDVEDGGSLVLAGAVGFGVASDDVAAVHTASATGFTLLCAVSSGFTLACDAATGEGAAFGSAVATDVATFDAICASVPRIANAFDRRGEMRGLVKGSSPTYALVWQTQTVPQTDAAGYYLDSAGNRQTAARIDRLFEKYSAALAAGELGQNRKIVILKDGTLSRSVRVPDGLTISGKSSGVSLDLSGAAKTVFTVTGGQLSVSKVSFTNYVGNAVFFVNGADASLRLGAGAGLFDIEGTNAWSGAIYVKKGHATLADGAVLDNCRATGKCSPIKVMNSSGGGVYVAAGNRLTLSGCTITNCYARNYGGGVYADSQVAVELSGELRIAGNTSGTAFSSKLVGDDLYLKNGGSRATATVADAVTGRVGVRWSSTSGDIGNADGLVLAGAKTAAIAHSSAAAFFCDADSTLKASPDDSVPALRWVPAPTGPQPWTGPVSQASAMVKDSDGNAVYYLLVSEALKAVNGKATIWVSGWSGNTIAEDITITNSVTLRSDTNKGFFWIDRSADCSLVIGKGGQLIMKDIVVYGSDVTNDVTMAFSEEPFTKPLFDVQGGELRMTTPSDTSQYRTAIEGVRGTGRRNAGAVSVWNGGIFRMYPGAEMLDCANEYDNTADGSGRGAAVLVDDGKADFRGGTVTGCRAYNGGGVFVGNKGKVFVSGDARITGNDDLGGKACNLVVHDLGSLCLDAKFTGSIGYTEGTSGSSEVFGYAAEGVAPADALSSAHNFTHDVTGDIGLAVTGDAGTLLVWSASLDSRGKYTDEDGNEYALVEGDAVAVAAPAAASGLVYNGKRQTGVEEGVGYTLTDGKKTNAGSYTAVATLRPGFTWSNGSTSAKSISWKIAKATYDMSAVAFADATYTYSGEYRTIRISGTLPDGVEVSYENNRQRDVGEYVATASFTGDSANYMAIPDKTAKLTIVAGESPEPPPDDPPGPSPVQPVPVAFSAVVGSDGTTWTLTVTDAVEKCWYSLYETNSLTGGFVIDGLEPVARRQAAAGDVPSIVFERTTDGTQVFWKVVAEPEDAH
ncbi:MAG: C10 family peptidase, partial [Kiritimatiellae bacterium]|nr:C10 family peptidase [Kiritimatiellia bacterium]